MLLGHSSSCVAVTCMLLFRRLSVALVVDLSKPDELWSTVDQWLAVLKARVHDAQNSDQSLKDTLRKDTWQRVGEQHEVGMFVWLILHYLPRCFHAINNSCRTILSGCAGYSLCCTSTVHERCTTIQCTHRTSVFLGCAVLLLDAAVHSCCAAKL